MSSLASRLARRRVALNRIRDEADRVDIFVGVFLTEGNGGLELAPDLLGELAKLRLAVGFDLYCVED